MKININFFANNIIDAIGAGIYKISVEKNENSKALYIGESVFVLVRCAAHLFELNKNPNYFGFEDYNIENPEVTLSFELIEKVNDSYSRKRKEKEFIKKLKPLCQSNKSDRMKSIDEKINALTNFLNQNQ